MENTVHSDELQHWGIKGQKWGQRRYQNKDGSLTPLGQKRYNKEVEKLKKETAKVKEAEKAAANRKKTQSKLDKLEEKKQALEERKKALKDDPDSKKEDKHPEETPEQRKERLLKSTNPKELYEGKDDLSSQELMERVNRIDLEQRLQSKIPKEEPKPSALDYVDKASNAINKATNLYRSVDSAYSTVANSAIGKMVAKQLGMEPPKKTVDIEEFWKNRHTKTSQEMMDMNKWLTAEEQIGKKTGLADKEAAAKKAKEESKQAKKESKQAEKEAKKEAQQAEKETKEVERVDKANTTSDAAERNQDINDQIRKAADALNEAAKKSNEAADRVTVSDDYIQDLIKKNDDKLNGRK